MADTISYSVAGASEHTGVSVDVIRRGDLAPRYFGSKPLIPAAELEAWLASLPSERGAGR